MVAVSFEMGLKSISITGVKLQILTPFFFHKALLHYHTSYVGTRVYERVPWLGGEGETMEDGVKGMVFFPGKEILFHSLLPWKQQGQRGRHRTEVEILTWTFCWKKHSSSSETMKKRKTNKKSLWPPLPVCKSVSTWGLISINILPANMSKKKKYQQHALFCLEH